MQQVNLDTPLLQLSPKDNFSLRRAVAGVLAMGQTGGGKTSAFKRLAEAYLRSGMGGLVLCAKPEEMAFWQELCANTGRSGSLMVLDGITPIVDFVTYGLARQGGAQGVGAVVDLYMRVVEIGRAASPVPGRQGEAFWEDLIRQILRNLIPIVYEATGAARPADLLLAARSAPTSPEQMKDPEWQKRSDFYRFVRAAYGKISDADGDRLMAYWGGDWASLDHKTRSNGLISFTTALDRFNHGWLREAFTTETYVPPELTFQGAVIVLAMPALTLNEDGIIAQQLYKYLWQRAVLARNALAPEQQTRPVFLWADEAQYFVNSFDAEYLATCRASLACTVFLTQSLPTMYAKLSHDGHDRVHHLLGNFGTRVFFSNACAETNEWAARTLGKSVKSRANYNQSQGTNTSYGVNMGEGSGWSRNAQDTSVFGQIGGFGWSLEQRWGAAGSESGNDNWGRNRGHGSNNSITHGRSEVMEYLIEPGDFGRILKTGGPANGNRVTAIWYQAGWKFEASGGNALLVEFVQ